MKLHGAVLLTSVLIAIGASIAQVDVNDLQTARVFLTAALSGDNKRAASLVKPAAHFSMGDIDGGSLYENPVGLIRSMAQVCKLGDVKNSVQKSNGLRDPHVVNSYWVCGKQGNSMPTVLKLIIEDNKIAGAAWMMKNDG